MSTVFLARALFTHALAEFNLPGHNKPYMTVIQEEALYHFIDSTAGIFTLEDVVAFMRKVESSRHSQLATEAEVLINSRNLAFSAGKQSWLSRRGFFEPLSFVIAPTRLELLNGILIPGHRCIPFAHSDILPHEYKFFWQDTPVPFTTTEGPPADFYPFYSIYGEEYAPQYVARDNEKNEAAFGSDPYDDPPEVSVKTLDMRNIYREASFIPGDRFTVKVRNWNAGTFELKKTGKDEWDAAELQNWLNAAESGFASSFHKLGPGSSTEEQITYAYWYGPPRMRELPAYSLEEFFFKKTEKIETAAYGIETRFWYAGREIPDCKGLDTSNARPDKTPVEEIFYRQKIPVSEFVIQSYVRDSLYRRETDCILVLQRLVPAGLDLSFKDINFVAGYIKSVLEEFRGTYNIFADKAMGPIRSRVAELHTAVVDLAGELCKGDIDTSWLPRHTFIILSQIQTHTAFVLEDLNSDEAPPEAELNAMDDSLDSMLETFEDMKELIDDALGSFRRNKFTLIRADSGTSAVSERLLQISVSGVDVWRRVIVAESCTLEELHRIIQTVFAWRYLHGFTFSAENTPEKSEDVSGKMELPANTSIKNIEAQGFSELRYEYGTKWVVRIMILSRHESPARKPVRCVAGAGTAPPESVSGPQKFRKMISALENGNDIERENVRQVLGAEFSPEEFDLDACNRNLNANFLQ